MTQLSFSQFIHPLSNFPNVANHYGNDEPMMDVYTMAGIILYSACANNNLNAKVNTLEVSAANAGLVDVRSLFERCKTGDRTAILEMIGLMAAGLEKRIQKLEPA
ncbi:MAG: hypothetical protein IGS39_06165 [Calothrix sp. C42_A2020_038]|nr:hypothetical protein [Calothrix sp. C42_A2020_038]